jgi:hypothetical protein
MSALPKSIQAPSWINIRNPGTCAGCQGEVKRGDSGLYDWNTQEIIRCGRCDQSAPARQPLAVVTATGVVAENSPQPFPRAVENQQPVTETAKFSPAAKSVEATPAALPALIQAIDRFAANLPGATRNTADRMLAAAMRAAAED